MADCRSSLSLEALRPLAAREDLPLLVAEVEAAVVSGGTVDDGAVVGSVDCGVPAGYNAAADTVRVVRFFVDAAAVAVPVGDDPGRRIGCMGRREPYWCCWHPYEVARTGDDAPLLHLPSSSVGEVRSFWVSAWWRGVVLSPVRLASLPVLARPGTDCLETQTWH